MDAKELLLPGGSPSGVWMCGKCHNVRAWPMLAATPANISADDRAEQSAHIRKQVEACCTPPACRLCRAPCPQYRLICDDCSRKRDREQERQRFEKAAKVEYDGGPVMTPGDRFFDSLESLEDHYADSDPEDGTRPEYVWLTKLIKFSPDLSGILLDRVHGDLHEDAADEIDGAAIKELDEYGKAWWAKHGVQSYEPDYSRCVVLHPAATEERA